MTIISPFDESAGGGTTTTTTSVSYGEVLDLTEENVEKVLEDMRPYLQQDGGDVSLQEIDGPIVKLELQGACGTCPSSTMTLKMGLERGLKERIPEIQEVIQVLPAGADLVPEEVEVVLDGVRPFLNVAGGEIECVRLTGVGGLQPTIWLKMTGTAKSLKSVKLEIAQRLMKHFNVIGLRVDWEKVD